MPGDHPPSVSTSHSHHSPHTTTGSTVSSLNKLLLTPHWPITPISLHYYSVTCLQHPPTIPTRSPLKLPSPQSVPESEPHKLLMNSFLFPVPVVGLGPILVGHSGAQCWPGGLEAEATVRGTETVALWQVTSPPGPSILSGNTQ